jgi:hypothetical protein
MVWLQECLKLATHVSGAPSQSMYSSRSDGVARSPFWSIRS